MRLTKEEIEKQIENIVRDITYKSKHGIQPEMLDRQYGEIDGLEWVLRNFDGVKNEDL